MYNKARFNKTTFNHEYKSSPFGANLDGSGDTNLQLSIPTILTLTVDGTSDVSSTVAIQTPVDIIADGDGDTSMDQLTIVTEIINEGVVFVGTGDATCDLVSQLGISYVQAIELIGFNSHPFNRVGFNKSALHTHITSPIKADGFGDTNLLKNNVFIVLDLSCVTGGEGLSTVSDVNLELPMALDLSGDGGTDIIDLLFTLEIPTFSALGEGLIQIDRISEIGVSTFTLANINLSPGEWVTIDMDNLTVRFNDATEDVSSVTDISEFFSLTPGNNDITFENSPGEDMEVSMIYNTRWL